MNRRTFLANAVGGAGLLVLPSGSARGYGANDRMNFALVGVSGYAVATAFVPGMHLYGNAGVAALCDVDARRLPKALKLWDERASNWPNSANESERRGAEVYQELAKKTPPVYPDFRRMLEERRDEIDAVVVATPDHSHAVISAAALRAGKPVLAEKPLTINVHEARALRELALKHPVATSMGNQGTQSPPFRRGVELIQEGVLGPVDEVHLWFPRGGSNHRQPPQGTEEIPPELHWDLWLGPVAARPYNPRWIARNHWRETSAGELGNFGPHTANLAFMALRIRDLWKPGSKATIKVRAEYSELNRLSFPRWEIIQWKLPARDGMPPVTFTWHHGPQPHLPPGSKEKLVERLRDLGLPKEKEEAAFKSAGALIVGSKGALLTGSHNTDFTLLPEEKFREVEKSKPKVLPVSRGHYKDWVAACRGGEKPLANFEYAATFNEFLMLGPVATQFGEELEYDPVAGRILSNADANAALGYEYRKGWVL